MYVNTRVTVSCIILISWRKLTLVQRKETFALRLVSPQLVGRVDMDGGVAKLRLCPGSALSHL